MSADEDHEAEVLLQIQRASIDEITQPAGAPPSVGERRTVVSGTELLVLSLTFTESQLQDVAKQLSVDAAALAAAPGEPVVVIVCGEYRVPILQRVGARRSSALNYVFYLPNLPIGVNLDASTPPEVLEAFEFIVKTYGALEDGGIPPLAAGTAAAPAIPLQNGAATSGFPEPAGASQQQQQPRDGGYNGGGGGGGAVPVPQPLGGAGGGGMYYAPPPRPPQSSMYGPPPSAGEYTGHHHSPGPTGPAPSYSHATLEEQQRAAVEAAKGNQVYEMPRQRPGSATRIIQVAYDVAPVRTATQIAHGIGEIARRATGIIGGSADFGSRVVKGGAQAVVDNTEKTQNPVQVPAGAAGHLRRGRMMSKGAVAVTGGFAATVVGVTSVISDQVSSRLRPMVPAGTQGPEPSTFDDVKTVGIATIGAAAAVTDAAMDAARMLLAASCAGATQIVSHKLGDEAGRMTEDGLGLAQDAVESAGNVRKAGLKSVAKVALKETAKKTVA